MHRPCTHLDISDKGQDRLESYSDPLAKHTLLLNISITDFRLPFLYIGVDILGIFCDQGWVDV